ncbi:MotA/TolQ/ExbB proton channel family protein [Patulibacter sp. NPDC049589]|uniref:MotA/TolQ/ExbB proton channel family protein n=1 Tax=Patulibacter sp. NPDC049589 TaxID=3154731 RepID=UPI0034470887
MSLSVLEPASSAVLGVVPVAEGAIADGLSGIAGSLDVPVHVLVLVALGVLALEVGRALTETWRRVRPGAPGVERLALRALQSPGDADILARSAPSPISERAILGLGEAARTRPDAAGRAKGYEKALTRYELDVQRRLDRTRMLVRSGPALGLMGTLIPLAPGLAALGKGDIAQLADDMQVAFAATVLGLVVGTLGFALTLVRTRVYTEDLSALESALETHAEATGASASGGGPGGGGPGGGGPGHDGGPAPRSGVQAGLPQTGWIGRQVHHGPAIEPTNGYRPSEAVSR